MKQVILFYKIVYLFNLENASMSIDARRLDEYNWNIKYKLKIENNIYNWNIKYIIENWNVCSVWLLLLFNLSEVILTLLIWS